MSCGCLALKHDGLRAGHRGEFEAWYGARQRCHHPRDEDYHHYGGRGITMCPEWRASFACFLADMGPRPSAQHSIDRIDNDGPYAPGNVRWATRKEQSRNRRNTRRITFNGETLCLSDWAARIGCTQSSLHERVEKWGIHRALTTPILGRP